MPLCVHRDFICSLGAAPEPAVYHVLLAVKAEELSKTPGEEIEKDIDREIDRSIVCPGQEDAGVWRGGGIMGFGSGWIIKQQLRSPPRAGLH